MEENKKKGEIALAVEFLGALGLSVLSTYDRLRIGLIVKFYETYKDRKDELREVFNKPLKEANEFLTVYVTDEELGFDRRHPLETEEYFEELRKSPQLLDKYYSNENPKPKDFIPIYKFSHYEKDPYGEKGFHVVIVGGKGSLETELCSRIADKLQNNCTNLCGKTSLRLLAAVISQASVVISPDSASMHLASSLNIPVIGLFAIHNPDRVGAWNFRKYEVSVYAQMAAAELGNKEAGWRYRVKNQEAMKAIDCQKVKEVFDRICKDYSLH